MSELSIVENVGWKNFFDKIGQKLTDLGYILLLFVWYTVFSKNGAFWACDMHGIDLICQKINTPYVN